MQGKEQLTKPARDFKEGTKQAKEKRQKTDADRQAKHRQIIADRRQALDEKRNPSRKTDSYERPVTHDGNESANHDRLKNPTNQKIEKHRPLTKQEHMHQ